MFAGVRVPTIVLPILGNGRVVPETELCEAFVTFQEAHNGITSMQKLQDVTAKLCTTPGCDHKHVVPQTMTFEISSIARAISKQAAQDQRNSTQHSTKKTKSKKHAKQHANQKLNTSPSQALPTSEAIMEDAFVVVHDNEVD